MADLRKAVAGALARTVYLLHMQVFLQLLQLRGILELRCWQSVFSLKVEVDRFSIRAVAAAFGPVPVPTTVRSCNAAVARSKPGSQ